MRATALVLAFALLAPSVGCLGSGDGDVESTATPSNETPAANQTLETRVVEKNYTLEWTHVRYGTYDNIILEGSNCVFVRGVSGNVTIQRMHVEANWDPNAGILFPPRVLQLQVRKRSLHVEERQSGTYAPPMNDTFVAWRQVPHDDYPHYAAFGWFPNTASEAHRDLQVTMRLAIEYVPDEPGARLGAQFPLGTCT